MPDIAEALPSALLKASEASLQQQGICPRPQVHILAEDMAQPYVGHVVSRLFYRGEDAASAIAALGILPSVLRATRLIVVWEDCDIRRALEMSVEGFSTAIAVLDARLDGHTLHWHPFGVEVTGTSPHGLPTVNPLWREPVQFEDAELLAPIALLLEVWRDFRDDDPQRTAIEFQEAGYEVNWARFGS